MTTLLLDIQPQLLATRNSEATVLTETMLSLIRQRRHLATRIIIATKEHVVSQPAGSVYCGHLPSLHLAKMVWDTAESSRRCCN
ncbi:hypothetical protein CIHG_10590 [Coccidioides immitis H538.4]|uniref:Uncharacterized protein n=1 Tax=Coccidioides immitis H538.4 TaxID=396776 RepID=A0A0N8FLL8_COCIT|nr:hypothetical protein CIHG_10590 [Coccidioides immitis H538.4]